MTAGLWWDPCNHDWTDAIIDARTEESRRLGLGALAASQITIRRLQDGKQPPSARDLAKMCGIGKDFALKVRNDTINRFYPHWKDKEKGPPPPREAVKSAVARADAATAAMATQLAEMVSRLEAMEAETHQAKLRAAEAERRAEEALQQPPERPIADDLETDERLSTDTQRQKSIPDQPDEQQMIENEAPSICLTDRQLTDYSPTLSRPSTDQPPTEEATSQRVEGDHNALQDTTRDNTTPDPREEDVVGISLSPIDGKKVRSLWKQAWKNVGGQGAPPMQAGNKDITASEVLAEQLEGVSEADVHAGLVAYLEADRAGALKWPKQGTATLHTLHYTGFSPWLPVRSPAKAPCPDTAPSEEGLPDNLQAELEELRACHQRGKPVQTSPELFGWLASRPRHPDHHLVAQKLAELNRRLQT